jgi:hypothetical protein
VQADESGTEAGQKGAYEEERADSSYFYLRDEKGFRKNEKRKGKTKNEKTKYVYFRLKILAKISI